MGGRLGDKEISCSKLQEKFPSVHPETVQRFYTAFAQESATRLMAYLEWRKAHVQLSTGDDTSDWRQAVTESSLYYTMGGSLRGLSHNPRTDSSLSFSQQVIFAPNVTDKEGYTVLHVLPARMDIGIDRSKEVYSCAFATYLETKLEDKPSDKVTFVVDTRAGRGWANPPMISMASTIKAASNILSELHPERLHRFIIYPVPEFTVALWRLIKMFLPKSVRDNIILVPGPACGRHAPVPKEELKVYLDEAFIDILEARRLNLFQAT